MNNTTYTFSDNDIIDNRQYTFTYSTDRNITYTYDRKKD